MRVMGSNDDGFYLISVDDDIDAALRNDDSKARVLVTEGKPRLHPPFSLHATISRGGWKATRMTREETDALLNRFGLPSVNS